MKLPTVLTYSFLPFSIALDPTDVDGNGVGPRATRKPELVDFTTDNKCTVRVCQWDYDKDTPSGRDRFDLEFSIETEREGRSLFHQPRVPVADGQPREAPASGVLAAGFTVTPTGNRLDFVYRGGHWAADRARCEIGQWSVAADVVPRLDVSCKFNC